MAQGQPGERGARGTEVQVRGRVVRGVRESPLRHALVRGGSADRRVGAHDWRREDGPEEDGPDKGEGPPATHAGFVGRGPPKPSWTIITKVTRTRWPRFGERVQDDASATVRAAHELPGSAPEHRPEADRLEGADRGVRDGAARSGSGGRGSPTTGSHCTVDRAASRGSSPGSDRPACPRSGTRAAAAAPHSRSIARRTAGPPKEGLVAQLTTGQFT